MASAASIADAFARLRAAGFVGRATKLADLDVPHVGLTIGVGEDEIHAIIDVEASSSGFDKLKRPKVLFELHRFYANLLGDKCARAVWLGLAYPNWKRDYSADSYPRLHQALAIDETAALKSASWGLGQIMGENYAPSATTVCSTWRCSSSRAARASISLRFFGSTSRNTSTTRSELTAGRPSRAATMGLSTLRTASTPSWPRPTRSGPRSQKRPGRRRRTRSARLCRLRRSRWHLSCRRLCGRSWLQRRTAQPTPPHQARRRHRSNQRRRRVAQVPVLEEDTAVTDRA